MWCFLGFGFVLFCRFKMLGDFTDFRLSYLGTVCLAPCFINKL